MKGLYFEPYYSSGSSVFDESCYICFKPGSISVTALVDSFESAAKIMRMYANLGLNVSALTHDKKSPDLHLGGCPDHASNLKKLEDTHKATKRITPKSIVDTLK